MQPASWRWPWPGVGGPHWEQAPRTAGKGLLAWLGGSLAWSAGIRLGRRPLGCGGHQGHHPSEPLSPWHSRAHYSEVRVGPEGAWASRPGTGAKPVLTAPSHVLSPPQVRPRTESSGAQLSGEQQVWSDAGLAVRVGPGALPARHQVGLLEGRGQRPHSRPRAGRARAWSSRPGPGGSGSRGWCSEATRSGGPAPHAATVQGPRPALSQGHTEPSPGPPTDPAEGHLPGGHGGAGPRLGVGLPGR